MWSGKFMARAGIEGYDILLTGDTRIPADDAGERKNKGVESTLKLLNKKAYNEIILEQEDTVSFQIAEEAKVKANKYGDSARQMWVKISRIFYPTTGTSKTRLRKKFAKCELYDATRDPKEWITELKILRGYLWKLNVQFGDIEMMTHILSNFHEAYEKFIENLEDELDDADDPLTIDRIRDKLLEKYHRMNV